MQQQQNWQPQAQRSKKFESQPYNSTRAEAQTYNVQLYIATHQSKQ